MTEITTLEVRLSPHNFDRAEKLIAHVQSMFPTMTIDDAVDFIFHVGMLQLFDQRDISLAAQADAPFGQAGQMVAAVVS